MMQQEFEQRAKKLHKQDLIDILSKLRKSFPKIVDRTIDNFETDKEQEKIADLKMNFEECNCKKEKYLFHLKEKYRVDTNEELFRKMNADETREYLFLLNEFNNAFDKLDTAYDKQFETFERRRK